MKRILSVLGAVLMACTLANSKETRGNPNKFDRAEYMQATAAGQKKAAPSIKGSLLFNAEEKTVAFVDQKGSPAFSVKYDSIKNILYEETSTPRYAEAVLISPLFIFSRSKKHFITIQYTDTDGTGRFVIFHMDKKNVREAVATAEAQTGKKVEHVEEK